MKDIKVLLVSCLLATTIQAKNYFFSAAGNDSNAGVNASTAWHSIQKLQLVQLKAGDSVLFRRGDKFYGEIVVSQSGKSNKPIVFSAFGKGDMPVLSGAILLLGFNKVEDNLQRVELQQKILKLYINNKKQVLARYPNARYLKIGEGIDKIGFETDLTQPDNYWKDTSIGMRTIDWVFELRNIDSFKDKKLYFDKPSIYKISKGYGYFLQNKAELIDSVGEWYSSVYELKILWKSDLKNEKVEGVICQNGFILKPGVNNIVINSIQIEKYAANGIWAQKGSGNLDISNNRILNVGYMGVWLDTLVHNAKVINNVIEDVAGRGISGIRLTNSQIEHNCLRRIGLSPGEGVSGVNGMIAIAIENNEKNHATSVSANNKIAYNEVDSTGYAGIRMDGKNSICEFNIVKNTSLKLNDSGAIYCFGKVKNRTDNNIIRNNLVLNAVGNVEATPSNAMATNGIYIDNNSTHILVENNTIIKVSNNGIFVNDASPKNTVRNNIIYDCSEAIGFAEWANKDSLYGCLVEKNIAISTDKSQKAVSLLTFMGPELKPGEFKNNTYVNYHDNFVINYKTDPEKGQRRHDQFRLANWQKWRNDEVGSVSIEKKGIQVVYNDSFTTKEILLPKGEFTDIKGNKLIKSAIIQPCAALLIVPLTIQQAINK